VVHHITGLDDQQRHRPASRSLLLRLRLRACRRPDQDSRVLIPDRPARALPGVFTEIDLATRKARKPRMSGTIAFVVPRGRRRATGAGDEASRQSWFSAWQHTIAFGRQPTRCLMISLTAFAGARRGLTAASTLASGDHASADA
jgi:hypothetical protein